jgi:hypothetical protein
MASLRELIELLHAKMARIRKLQTIDPNIIANYSTSELKEFEQLEKLETDTKKALEKKAEKANMHQILDVAKNDMPDIVAAKATIYSIDRGFEQIYQEYLDACANSTLSKEKLEAYQEKLKKIVQGMEQSLAERKTDVLAHNFADTEELNRLEEQLIAYKADIDAMSLEGCKSKKTLRVRLIFKKGTLTIPNVLKEFNEAVDFVKQGKTVEVYLHINDPDYIVTEALISNLDKDNNGIRELIGHAEAEKTTTFNKQKNKITHDEKIQPFYELIVEIMD